MFIDRPRQTVQYALPIVLTKPKDKMYSQRGGIVTNSFTLFLKGIFPVFSKYDIPAD